MAELSLTIEEEFLTCKICLEFYVDPKVLPCLHTFCLSCISSHFDKTRKGCKALCPLCRATFEVPGCQPANIKSNFYINSLSEVINTKKKSTKSCTFCEMKNVISACRWICITCMDYLCEACKQNHQGTRVTFDHQTISIEQLMSGVYDQVIRKKTDIPCLDHDNEKVRFFCETCSQLVCLDCVLLKHRDHTYRSPADAMKIRRTDMEQKISKAQAQMKIYEENKNFITDLLSEIDKSEISQIASLKTFCKTLKDAIDQKMNETEKTVRVISEESRRSLGERKTLIDEDIQTLKEPLELCKDLLENGRDEEILYFRESFEDRLQTPITHANLRRDLHWTKVEVSMSETIEQLIKEKSVQSTLEQEVFTENRIPCMEMTASEIGGNEDSPRSLLVTEHPSAPNFHSLTQPYVNGGKYRLIKTFNCYIGYGSEFVPEPTGVAWITSQRIAVCDAENKQLKVFTRNGETDWFIDIKVTPIGLSVVEGKIAIAVSDGVLIYQNDTRVGLIKCKADAFRYIASTSLEILLFGTDGDEVRRYDSKGKRQGTIRLEAALQPMAVSCNDRILVVSDKRRSEAVIFNYEGKKMRSVQRNQTSWLADAHCLQNDRVLMVNKQSSKVVILQDGAKYLGGWSTEPEITKPCCIDYHSDGFLVIGGAGGNIAVYQFI
ncbi:transcription intermediary factor 1-alpha-like [Ylistrum balloti]|uniref:transcription intermediary factor 1-alpha-like n=1 Tax=Ylistrum balloti TaxID=509963 RepID=UPI002905EC50|nr:transcription intermediary factor 1-alpha-like [Ylistrum balloti]